MILGPLLPPAQLPLPSPFSSFLAEAQPEQPRQPSSASPWRPAPAQLHASQPQPQCSPQQPPRPAVDTRPRPSARSPTSFPRPSRTEPTPQPRPLHARRGSAPSPRPVLFLSEAEPPRVPLLLPAPFFRSRSRLGGRNRRTEKHRRPPSAVHHNLPSPSRLRPRSSPL